ncbi:MAG: ABC transporter permease [Chloroflexota bacterium]
MRPYLTVFRIKLLASLQYRTAALAKLAPPLFVGLIQVMFFSAFYRNAGAGQPLTLTQTITYCWIIQLLVHVQPWSGDPEALAIIRNGNIAYELCRPLDLYGQWFSRLAAHRLVPLVVNSLPLAAVALFAMPPHYRMSPPVSPGAALVFLLSLVGVVLMSAALSNILSIVTIWTINGDGLYYLFPVVFIVLSGANVPLPLFPPALQRVINILPFRALIDTPAQIYLGTIPPLAALPQLFSQLLWTAGFVALGRLLLARALRSVVVQGG